MGLVSDLFQEYTQDIPEPTVDASAHWMPGVLPFVNTGPGTHQSVAGNLGKTPEIRAQFDQMNPVVPEPTVDASQHWIPSWFPFVNAGEGTHQQAAGNLGKTPQQRAAFTENTRNQELLNRTYEDYGAESPVDEVLAIAAESQVRQQQQQEAGDLAQFAQGFGEATTFGVAPTLGREAATAVSKSGATFASMIARGLGSDYYADKYAREANLIEGATEEIRQEDSLSPWLSRIYGGTLTSLLQIAPGAAAGGGVAPIIASAAGGEYTSAAQEARDIGLSDRAAAKYALEQGVIEGGITAGFQMLGLGGLESALTKKAASNTYKELAKNFLKQTGQELPEELTIEFFHNISRAAAKVDPNADNYENQLQTAIDTTAQTIMTMGLVNAQSALGVGLSNKADRAEAANRIKALLPYVTDEAARSTLQRFVDSPSRQNLDKAKPVYDEWVKTPEAQAAAESLVSDQVDSVLGPAAAPETQQEAPQQPQTTPEPQQQPEAVTEPPVSPEQQELSELGQLGQNMAQGMKDGYVDGAWKQVEETGKYVPPIENPPLTEQVISKAAAEGLIRTRDDVSRIYDAFPQTVEEAETLMQSLRGEQAPPAIPETQEGPLETPEQPVETNRRKILLQRLAENGDGAAANLLGSPNFENLPVEQIDQFLDARLSRPENANIRQVYDEGVVAESPQQEQVQQEVNPPQTVEAEPSQPVVQEEVAEPSEQPEVPDIPTINLKEAAPEERATWLNAVYENSASFQPEEIDSAAEALKELRQGELYQLAKESGAIDFAVKSGKSVSRGSSKATIVDAILEPVRNPSSDFHESRTQQPEANISLPEDVLSVAWSLSEKRKRDRVYLVDIFDEMENRGYGRQQITDAIFALEREGALASHRIDNTQELSGRLATAGGKQSSGPVSGRPPIEGEIRTPAGNERHIVLLIRRPNTQSQQAEEQQPEATPAPAEEQVAEKPTQESQVTQAGVMEDMGVGPEMNKPEKPSRKRKMVREPKAEQKKPAGEEFATGYFIEKVGSKQWKLTHVKDGKQFDYGTYPTRKKAREVANAARGQESRTATETLGFKGANVKGKGKTRSKATADLVKEYGVSEQEVDSAIEQAAQYLQEHEDKMLRPLRQRISRSYNKFTFSQLVRGEIEDADSLVGFDDLANTIAEDIGSNENMTGQELFDWIQSLNREYDTKNQTYNANHPRVIEEARKILDSATGTPTEQDEDISFDPATFEDPESPYFMNTRGVGRGTREEVYGPEEEPSDPTPSTPPVTKGGKKLMNDLLRSKGNKSTRTLAGIRNIGEYMADLAHAIVLIGDSQTSKRSPAHYIWDERRKGAKKSPSVIRSRGPEGMFLFHEAGHALDIMLSSIKPKWWGKKDISEALIGLTHLPGSMASAKTRVEGIAEFIRLYIVDPGRIPTSLRSAMESNIAAVDPRIMQGIQDARRAYREWSSWDMGDALQSINRSGRKGKTGLEGATDAAWWALYQIAGPNVALTRMNRKMWNPILKSLQGYGEALMKSVEGTAADADPMYQSLVRVQSETNTILYDDKSANRGIRVFASEGNPFSELTEEAVEALEELGLDIPTDAARSGNYIYLTDFSFQDIRDSIGEDNWNLFETYGQYKAALERYRVKGHAFPGMFDKKPADIEAWVEQVEQENPLFQKEFKRVQKFFDQLLLTGMMSGEFSLNEVVNIKKQWKDYWPLLRKDDEGKVLSRGAPEAPSSGVRRAFGSHERFRSLNEAAAYRVSSALQSYYRLRAMKAVKNMAEVVAGNLVVATHEDGRKMLINRIQMQNNKDFSLPDGFTLDATADAYAAIPWEAKTEAARVMLPLSTEKGLAATLTEGDEAKIVLKAIKEMQSQGAIGLDPDEDITIEDIAIYTPGGTQIFRGKKPKAVRVIRMFENGENKYYQITDDMLFDMFAHGSYTPSRVMDFFAKAVNSLLVKTLRPWKQRLTQNLPFALANAVVRDAFNAVFMSKDGVKGMLPSFYMTRAVFNNYFPESWLNKIGLNKHDSPTQGELLSQSLNATHHKTQLSIIESFYETVADGIYIEDWRNMSFAQKSAEIPGILSSLIGKPIDILNWGMGGKFASQKSETLSREGAYYAALDRGASQERALMEYDKITGNFAHHQPHSGLAMLIRQAGFLNAGLQITWGQMERWLQPSANATIGGTPIPYLSKNQTGMAIRLAAIASGAVLAAAAKHAILSAWMDDDDYEEYVNNLREMPKERRLRKATIWFPLLGEIQLPFDYGIVGGFQSWGFNMAEDYIIGRDVGSAKEKAQELLNRVKEGIPVVGGGWTDLLHPIAKTAHETRLGESGYSHFYGDHIVPPYLVDNELDPSERAFADTPTIYKWIGKQTGTSPLKVQYVTRSLLTAAADDTAYLIDKLKDGKDVSVKDVPSLKRIFAKPYTGFNSESVQRLQELDKEWQLAGQKINNAVKRGDLSQSEINTLKEQRARLDRAHFAWEMSEDLWKNAKEARLQDKMDVYDKTTKDMTKLAQSFMRWYDSGKAGLTPTMAEFATDDTKTALVYGALENLSTESDRDKSDENDWLISNRREMVKELGLTYDDALELLNRKWHAEQQEAENKAAFKKGREPRTIPYETREEGRYAGGLRRMTDAHRNRIKRLQEIYSNE